MLNTTERNLIRKEWAVVHLYVLYVIRLVRYNVVAQTHLPIGLLINKQCLRQWGLLRSVLRKTVRRLPALSSTILIAIQSIAISVRWRLTPRSRKKIVIQAYLFKILLLLFQYVRVRTVNAIRGVQ